VAPLTFEEALAEELDVVLLRTGRDAPVETTLGGFLRLVGREVFLAFK